MTQIEQVAKGVGSLRTFKTRTLLLEFITRCKQVICYGQLNELTEERAWQHLDLDAWDYEHDPKDKTWFAIIEDKILEEAEAEEEF